MIVPVDTKKPLEVYNESLIKYKGYDFPKEPPKPTVPPRAPKINQTLTKTKKAQAPKAPPYLQFNFQNDHMK